MKARKARSLRRWIHRIAKGAATKAAPKEPKAGAADIGALASASEPAREPVIKAAREAPVASAMTLPCSVGSDAPSGWASACTQPWGSTPRITTGRKAKTTAPAAIAIAMSVCFATRSWRKKNPISAAHSGLSEKNMMALAAVVSSSEIVKPS
eukprot:scaffold293551_cov31-Tisochrysis_lutea.AAC.3